MNFRVEDCPGDIEIIIRGPKDSPELARIRSLLQEDNERLWGWDDHRVAVAISPKAIVWAEMVDNKVFVYTSDAIYETSMGLAELENKWEAFGFFRCAKSFVINLHAVQSLRSCSGGRIEAIMATGEKVIVFRRYSPLLRERIQEGV